jgi:hypothetical protein
MKPKSSLPKIAFATAMLLGLSGVDSSARPPRARELCGVIQAIDPQTHTLTIESPKRAEPLTVVLKRETKFIKNWKFTEQDSLAVGQHACIYYRSPMFGRPFVTKVVWTTRATRDE